MEKEKTYTTTEIMQISGLCRGTVLKRAKDLGFTKYARYFLKKSSWGNTIKEFSFTESQVKQMGCDHKVTLKEKQNDIDKVEDAETLEALKREHPLVTDERCFKRSWFPETIPSVFNEDDEEEK
jgi:hypothetical protein